ncbi:MAG: hypothetical protein ABIH20_02505 [Candidatus Diapherotrites archaeon]
MKTSLVLLVGLVFLLGCAQGSIGTPSDGSFSVADIVAHIEDFEGKTVLVKGSLGLQGCTKMACVPEKACCNSCFAELSDLNDPAKTINVTGMDCAFNNSWRYLGKITKQDNGYVLVLIEPKENEEVFEFGKEFTITENKVYVPKDQVMLGIITITGVSFEDSRCPEGVQCVWAGEQGVTLLISSAVSSHTNPDEMYLGETTNPTAELYGFNFKLISIYSDKTSYKKFAKIIVTKKEFPTGKTQWFSIEPIQCGGNDWSQWSVNNEQYKTISAEETIIKGWFEIEHGIIVQDFASKQIYELVCEACSCPRGDTIAVLVDSSHKEKMLELGFEPMGEIGCTKEAMVCPDGSGIGREAPFCDFPECPT